jgi:hypothetical protein
MSSQRSGLRSLHIPSRGMATHAGGVGMHHVQATSCLWEGREDTVKAGMASEGWSWIVQYEKRHCRWGMSSPSQGGDRRHHFNHSAAAP